MKHFQYSVMGHGILFRSLGWATKISEETSFSPPAHPSSHLLENSEGFRFDSDLWLRNFLSCKEKKKDLIRILVVWYNFF